MTLLASLVAQRVPTRWQSPVLLAVEVAAHDVPHGAAPQAVGPPALLVWQASGAPALLVWQASGALARQALGAPALLVRQA